MNMKKTLIASAIGLMAITSTITAQACGCFGPGQGPASCGMMQPGPAMGGGGRGLRGGGPGRGVDSHLERMTVMLGLNPEQQAEIRSILEVQQATRQAMQETMREAMKEQVDAVLTPEQRARHDQMMPARDQGVGGKGKGCGRGLGRRGPGWGPGTGSGAGPGSQASPVDTSVPTAPIPAN